MNSVSEWTLVKISTTKAGLWFKGSSENPEMWGIEPATPTE